MPDHNGRRRRRNIPETLLAERRGAALVLTMNRPEKLNALNRELISSLARQLDIAETDDSGLLNRVVPRQAVLDEAIKLADLIASKSGPAVSASMLAISRGLNTSIDEGLLIEAAAFEAIVPAEETMAGIRSFLGARQSCASDPDDS